MKVENKTYWENQSVIKTQDAIETKATFFEKFMFQEAKNRLHKNNLPLLHSTIYGCGTGREINEIVKFFGDISIAASDISENMIKKCNENVQKWQLNNVTTTVQDASKPTANHQTSELVTLLNSMMTYVHVRAARKQIFMNANQILVKNGVLIGAVHNQEGVLTKTWFFKLRNWFKFFLSDEPGHRFSGSKEFQVKTYYYTKKELEHDLKDAEFQSIEIFSLEEFYKSQGESYNRKTGYNNLIFIAQK